jgi:hypothetical protein
MIWNVVRHVSAVAIAALAALRCMIAFAPDVLFDSDPVLFPEPYAGLGPAGSLWLDVAIVLCCAAALLAEWMSRRAMHWGWIWLAVLPIPVVAWHGMQSTGNLWLGATWTAAMLSAATIAHLARHPRLRILVIAMLLSVLGPLLVRGALNVTIEYDATIADYQQHKTQIFADRGWTEDSPSAAIFERRLEQRNPTAWFLTTNIYGSFMGAGLIVCIGLAIAAARAKLGSGWWGLAGLLAIPCAIGLWLSGSKGALLASAAVLAIVLAIQLGEGLRARIARVGGWIAIGLIAVAIGAVVVRGSLLPESFHGEKSLLFRSQYMSASARIMADAPVVGVGPDGYKLAYTKHREPRNPEEVSSAHNVLLDWLTTLGAPALAWVALLIGMVWRSGRNLALPDDADVAIAHVPETAERRAYVLLLGLGTLLACIPALRIEIPVLGEFSVLLRLLGAMSFFALALVLGHVMVRADGRWFIGAVAAGALLMVMHGQIEMTGTQPASAVWMFSLLGVAAAPGLSATRASGTLFTQAGGAIVLVLIALWGGWLHVRGVIPVVSQQRIMAEAATELRACGEARAAFITYVQESNTRPVDAEAVQRSYDLLVQRMERVGIHVPGPDALAGDGLRPVNDLLVRTIAATRFVSADHLRDAYDANPRTPIPLYAAAQQVERATTSLEIDSQVRPLLQGTALAEQAFEQHTHMASGNLAVLMRMRLFELTVDESHLDAAIDITRRMAEYDPHGINVWRRLGDLQWEMGRRDEAAIAYHRALEASDNFALDPLKQLPADVCERIKLRIGQVEGFESGSPP